MRLIDKLMDEPFEFVLSWFGAIAAASFLVLISVGLWMLTYYAITDKPPTKDELIMRIEDCKKNKGDVTINRRGEFEKCVLRGS